MFRSRIGRTVTEADNVWFTAVTHNTNQVHFNAVHASGTRFGRELVNSCFVLALVTGLSVPDTSENAVANLGWDEVRIPAPVFVGDTLWAETEVLQARRSRSNAGMGIVGVRTRGINQRGQVVLEFRRTFMIPLRESGSAPFFPETDAEWTV